MLITINDETQDVIQDCTLDQLMKIIGRTETGGIAIARNNEVVSRDFWANTCLKENDKVMIIQATQGG